MTETLELTAPITSAVAAPSANPFGITREEILNLAAQKVADEYCDTESVGERSMAIIKQVIEQHIKVGLTQRIDNLISAEVERLLSAQIIPLDIWGDKVGAPTTIRAALEQRARDFWEQKVDKDGKLSGDSYYGKPRHEWLFERVVKDQFAEVVKQNITNLVGAFKDALVTDAHRVTKEHIDSIIKIKSLGDR